MPLKLNVGLSRKVGEDNYGSRGASVHIELEVESALASDPGKLQERIRQVFNLVRSAVAEELNGSLANNGATNNNNNGNNHPPANNGNGSSNANGNGHGSSNGNGGNGSSNGNGNGRSNGRFKAATTSQVRAIRAIASSKNIDLLNLLRDRYRASKPEELSIGDASELIDSMKAQGAPGLMIPLVVREARHSETIRPVDHLSYSAIQTYSTCPRQFEFRYVLRRPEAFISSSLVVGTAIHRCVEAHFQALLEDEALPDLDTLLGIFWDSWARERKAIRWNKGEDLDGIALQADRLLRAFQVSDFAHPNGRLIGIEEDLRGVFSVHCPEFWARIDLLIETDEALQVIDFKTARHRWSERRVNEAAPQLLVYHELVQGLVSKPVQLAFAVLTKAKKPKLTLHPVACDPARLEHTRQRVEQIWDSIRLCEFPAKPSFAHCPRCPYQSLCDAWSPR